MRGGVRGHVAAHAGVVAASIAMVGLSIGRCAHGVAKPSPPDPLFVDATPPLGRFVSVPGTLRWKQHERGLYPADTTKTTMSREQCLPVLIRTNDKALAESARRLHGATVRIDGVVVRAAALGRVSVFSCNPVGIEVVGLRPER